MKRFTIFSYLLAIFVITPSLAFASSCDNLGSLDNYTDAELQSIFDVCNKEIAQEKAALQNKKAQTQSISRDLSTIDSQIKKSNAYIKAKEIEIYRINKEITGEKKKLQGLELQEQKIQQAMGSLIRKKNELDNYGKDRGAC